MSLARELKMTRKQILDMGSYEFSMWESYYTEVNKPPEPPKQSPELIAAQLKSAFAAHKGKKAKRK
jgi:hypothetical protein